MLVSCLERLDSQSQVSTFLQVCVTLIEELRGPLVEGPSLLSRHTDSSVNQVAWTIWHNLVKLSIAQWKLSCGL